MMRYTSIAIAASLAVMPAPGQIIQRMERDVVAAEKLQQTLETAPLLGLADLKRIALFSRFSHGLRSEEAGILRRTALRLTQGDYALARKDWESALRKMKEREFEPDIDALVHGVLQQAYLEKNTHYRPLAAAVQFREQQRDAVYQERTRLEGFKAAFDEGRTSGDRKIRPLILADQYAPRVPPTKRAESKPATADSVSEELRRIGALCNEADGNAQQSVVDLQKGLDEQVLQNMSNVSKMLHDAAMPIIGNMKG